MAERYSNEGNYLDRWTYRDFQARLYEVALQAYQETVKAYRDWLSDYKSDSDLELPTDEKLLSRKQQSSGELDPNIADRINRLLDPDKEEENTY